MNRFEHLVHTRRRSEGELSVDRIGEAWVETPGRAVRRLASRSPTATGCGGPTCPTSSTRPGYVYAYAYGQLLALSAYGRYREEGESFVPRYLELLAAGGSRSPEELARSSASTSPTRASGTPAWRSSRSSSRDAEELAAARPRRPLRRSSVPRALAGCARERSSWRSTTLTISFITCSIPVAFASPVSNASRQSRTWPLVASSLKCERGIAQRDLRVGGDRPWSPSGRAARPGRSECRRARAARAPATSFSGWQRRHLLEKPRDRGLDQRLGVRWRGQVVQSSGGR